MFNLVVLSGRMTTNAELKTTPSGVSVTTFSIAVDRKGKAGEEKQTDFINIVAWRNTAKFITKYFSKGNMIGIEGSIQTRKYTNKNGNNRTIFEVVANNVQFLESKKGNENGSAPQKDPLSDLKDKLDDIDEDLAF